MRTQDFDYSLPPELIAQSPVEPRDSSRLLVLHRSTGAMEHRRFCEIGCYLDRNDVLVLNDTRVIPARLRGRRRTGASVEILLLRQFDSGSWEALVRPGRVKDGEAVELVKRGRAGGEAVIGVRSTDGTRRVQLSLAGSLEDVGEVPLPPYVRRPLADAGRYQTVYARAAGSVAAPTAGLHFTSGLLDELAGKGVRFAFVTLHVGLDTFRPVKEDDPTAHRMHTEYARVSPEAASVVERARAEGGRVVCVGTTSVRTVEAVAASNDGRLAPYAGRVDLFILPGHRFRLADVMVTNFHLPRTTLLMLTAAFAGTELVLRAYQEAIRDRYRFYSLGDAMLVL